jgi:hypothetical protein
MKQIPLSIAGSNAYLTVGAGNFDITVTGTGTGEGLFVAMGPGNDTAQVDHVKDGGVTLGPGNSTVTLTGVSTNDLVILQSVKGNTDVVDAGQMAQGAIVAGNGNTVIHDAGAGAYISVGDGNNDISASGNSDVIVAGSGRNTIQARGDNDLINVAALGGKSDVIVANGRIDTIVSAGGDSTIVAGGAYDHISINAGYSNVVALGWADTISVGGDDDGTPAKADVFVDDGSSVYVSGHTLYTTISEAGILNRVFLTDNGSAAIGMGLAGNTVIVDGTAGDYGGQADINDLGTNVVDLHQITGLGTFTEVKAALVHAGGNWKLPIPGGGDIVFIGEKPTAANFSFT